jgi:ABC-2 type transport system permease protein
MKRIWSQVIKELTQFRRDRLTVMLAFVLPAITLLMFGWVTRLESKDIAFAVINLDSAKLSRDFVDTLFANQQVRPVEFTGTNPLTPLDRDQAEGTLLIPPEFSRYLKQGRQAHIQLAVDASDVNNARVLKGGVLATVNYFSRVNDLMKGQPFIQPRLRLWFNPGRREALYIVPGAYGLIVWIFPSLLSALALSREKEQGTMLQLYASSLTSKELVAGKAIAYLFVGLAEALLLLVLAMSVFGTRFAGSPLTFVVDTVLYVLVSVLFGQVAAARTATSIAAMQLASTVGFTTAFLLSGFIYPVRNIAFPFNYLSIFVPARYYMEGCRDAFLRGGDPLAHWHIPVILAISCAVCFFVASKLLSRMQLTA